MKTLLAITASLIVAASSVFSQGIATESGKSLTLDTGTPLRPAAPHFIPLDKPHTSPVPAKMGGSPTTATLHFSWDSATDNTLTGYKIYEHVGTSFNQVDSFPAPATTRDLPNVPSGTHAYVMTALKGALESDHSNEASVVIPFRPDAPTGMSVTVVSP